MDYMFIGAVLCVAAVAALAAFLCWLLSERPQHQCPRGFYATGGRRFLITGAAGGIGSELARFLLDEGHCVALSDVGAIESPAQSATQWLVLKHDVSVAELWRAALAAVEEKWGGVDVVINCAGYLRPGALLARHRALTTTRNTPPATALRLLNRAHNRSPPPRRPQPMLMRARSLRSRYTSTSTFAA